MLQNFHYYGAIPATGKKQVRIHWLLNLVSQERTLYNFTHLDRLLDTLHINYLRPGFEIMGNPSNTFDSFDDPQQVARWKELVTLTANRYLGRYGLEEVSSWNFETWNEPDHGDFDNLNVTLIGFLRYFQACRDGLSEASRRLRLGGPGGSCHTGKEKSPICWAVLNYCATSANASLDFISFHKKGGGQSRAILQQELQTISKIHRLFPQLRTKPIFNDEGDPLVGWSRAEWWRSDATYAALATKVLGQHINQYFRRGNQSYEWAILSNDNAFLSYHPHHFTQRTLLARFQMNQTQPPHVRMIRKPIFAATALWSLLGDRLLSHTAERHEIFGAVATFCMTAGSEVAVLMYNSDDVSNNTCTSNVKLTLKNITRNAVAVLFAVDNLHTNPNAVWRRTGSPAFPNATLFQAMQQQEGPRRLAGPHLLTGREAEWRIKLPLPGVALVHVCSRLPTPKRVRSIRFVPITSQLVLISWCNVGQRCILEYEVEYSGDARHFVTINGNQSNSFLSLFLFDCRLIQSHENCTVQGFYRVRSVDYWHNHGPYSRIFAFHALS